MQYSARLMLASATGMSPMSTPCRDQTYRQKLRDLQYLMYAENKRSLLICLQGRDAAGKDGTINHVLGAMNPQE